MTTKEQYAAWKKRKIEEDFNGSEEAFNAWRKSINSKGGKNTPPEKRNFSVNRDLAKRAGSVGGKSKKIHVKSSKNNIYKVDVATPQTKKTENETNN